MKTSSDLSRHFLALWFPHLSTDRLRRENPWRRAGDTPLIVVDRIANTLRLTAVDRNAAAAGLHIGMALTDARALFQKLEVANAAPAEDERLLDRLADWCHRYSPLVALDHPHGIVLDITGCDHLFGGLEAMLRDVVTRLRKNGFAVKAAIAGNASAARALARFSQGGVFPANGEESVLRALPLVSFEIEEASLVGLKRAGLRTIGDVAGLPRAALTARFGEAVVDRLDALFGHVTRPVSPLRMVPVCAAARRMAEPLIVMEAVEALLRQLGDELFAALEERGEGAREIEAAFFRVDGLVRRVSVQAGRPLVETAPFFRLIRERLSALAEPLDAGYGFDAVQLAALRVERVTHRQTSLDSRREAASAVDALVDRLSARLGPARVLRPIAVDTHIPERAFSMVPAIHQTADEAGKQFQEKWKPVFRQELRKDKESARSHIAANDYRTGPHYLGDPPARPIRLFQPPQRIEAMAEVPDGPPMQFRWRRVLHEVALAEGPERIAPEWWRVDPEAATRDYYRIEDNAGRRFWIFREGLYGRDHAPQWFLHGLFA
ncbi:imuB protein [Paramesorhizobium deserti]|uniref:ImuB protein n=1 Tax=Paramesorhizobium deserti TaxID=1494590 RepID=A0A135I0K7_9HYPH|nr:DNA polymerase Y family protein [Paramesorhizobium deserti]KXF78972.1 imuB protein [Paramesorhizobium deserti]